MTQESPFWYRALGLGINNPWIMQTLVRMEYRHRFGIPYDRDHRQGLSGPPSNLALVLTKQCNLHCVMCRQVHSERKVSPKPQPDSAILPAEAWISLLDQVRSFKPWLYLTGGEPLLYPHFTQVVEAARDRRLTVHLQTNGTLLKKVADFLVASKVAAVTVSIDGPPAIHDRIRDQQGAFQRLATGIEALLEARRRQRRPNPILAINCTISKLNASALADMTSLAIQLGADVLQIQHTMFNSPEKVDCHNSLFTPEKLATRGLSINPPSIAPGEYYQNELDAADIAQLREGLIAARKLAHKKLKLVFMPNLSLDSLSDYYLNLDYPFAQGCDFFWKTFRVNANGDCSPCLSLKFGNIREQSFNEIWNGPAMQAMRNYLKNAIYPGCARCCHRSYVAGSRAF